MDVMSLSSSTSNDFIKRLSQDYPGFIFKAGKQEHWSPKTKTIIFNPNRPCFGVLHELAHAILDHSDYHGDFELLKLESDAWELAAKIGQSLTMNISKTALTLIATGCTEGVLVPLVARMFYNKIRLNIIALIATLRGM
jgi:hypothetical protein